MQNFERGGAVNKLKGAFLLSYVHEGLPAAQHFAAEVFLRKCASPFGILGPIASFGIL